MPAMPARPQSVHRTMMARPAWSAKAAATMRGRMARRFEEKRTPIRRMTTMPMRPIQRSICGDSPRCGVGEVVAWGRQRGKGGIWGDRAGASTISPSTDKLLLRQKATVAYKRKRGRWHMEKIGNQKLWSYFDATDHSKTAR